MKQRAVILGLEETIAPVALVQATVSEDELDVYEAALSSALDTLGESEIKHRFGASVDEIEDMRDDPLEVFSAA